jgi:glycosyltransferase involved in cell wall biosynthesis
MRVIHLMNHCRFGHGNVHAAVDLACAQTARGDAVCIASGHGEFEPLLAAQGIAFAPIDQEHRTIPRLASAIWRLQRLVREFRPDILHAHMMSGAVLGAIASRVGRIPLVTTVHNAFDRHAILMRVGDRVIGVSDAVSDGMIARGVPRAKVRTVLNGTLGAPRRDFFPPEVVETERPSIGSLGGLHTRKGVADLIEAFGIVAAAHPTVRLNIFGDGPDRPEYERQAAALPSHDRIRFWGEVRDTRAALGATDIFALPSHAEPFGLVLTEAREAGCAIVASDVDGVPQVLDEGAAGLLVPPRDPPALAAAILSLLTDDARMAAAKAAAQRNLDRWSVDRVAAETDAVYRELTDRH